jgi:hypothetical protein
MAINDNPDYLFRPPLLPLSFTFRAAYPPQETKIGGKTFKSISDEEFRIYYFLDDEDKVFTVRIDNPAWLRATETGSHRVVDARGHGFYIPSDFTHIEWKKKPGMERVNF